jgi:lycopene cyclase domain-containing protein
MSLYLILNIFTFSTIFLSFDKKVAFYKYFPYLLIGIIINGIIFIPWDILFTQNKVWGFNPNYLFGIFILDLPLEEWLFFITVPFSCVFIHFVLKAYFKNPISLKFSTYFWYSLSLIVLFLGVLFNDQLYTFTTFIITPIIILLVLNINKEFMRDFLFTYMVSFIPFIIINSILTGSFTDDPIVWYNNDENFSIRIGTIPIEDTIYNMLLLLIPAFITQFLFNKKAK